MDEKLRQSSSDDLEDGELSDISDDNVYTPLQRPNLITASTRNMVSKNEGNNTSLKADTEAKTVVGLEGENSQHAFSGIDSYSSDESSSDMCLEKISKVRAKSQSQRRRQKFLPRTVMVRVQPTDMEAQEKRARFKKYNVWTSAIHEELSENMRGCDVTSSRFNDRNVENYDYTLQNCLNGENTLKRCFSNIRDDLLDSECPSSKRERRSSTFFGSDDGAQRRSVKSRLGHRSSMQYSSTSTSSCGTGNKSRIILDLNDTLGRTIYDVAKEIATNLYEENDDLIVRILEVLGMELPTEIFKETQRIEASGGLMIKNGKRRRTPGGVFLFLLKNHERLTLEDQKSIFYNNQQITNKLRKDEKSISRDRKVEELKKRLSEQDTVLPTMNRKEIVLSGSNLSLEARASNLSNPPPSPAGREHSPEDGFQTLNHVTTDANVEKPSVSSVVPLSPDSCKDIVHYDDDILDVNCGEMDFF